MNKCPSCGSTTSLNDLEEEIKRLEAEKRRRQVFPRRAIFTQGMKLQSLDVVGDTVDGCYIDGGIGPAPELTLDAVICANCGTVWKPNARIEAERLRDRAAELKAEIFDVVERLGELSEQELRLPAAERERLKDVLDG